MKAQQILDHFRAFTTWQDPDTTVDRFIIGDPDRDVSEVGVTWISSFAQIREAVGRGVHLLITHEPTFWVHANELATVESWPSDSPRRRLADRKRAYIEEHDLTILRLHDSWDGIPEIGIPWTWARHLGFVGAPAAVSRQAFQQRYDIEPIALDALAGRVAAATATLGEPAVQVVGPPDRLVSKVGIGTGCYCDIPTFLDLGCDVSIVCDDSNWYWEGLQFAADGDHAIIRVNHGVSEEPGMVALTEYLNSTFPELTAHHLRHGASFRLVGKV